MASRVALFDVDGVVLHGKGLNLFARYLVSRGEAKPALAMRGAWYALGHRLGWLDGGAVLRRVAAAYLTGRRAAEFVRKGEEWFVERGAAAIYPEAGRSCASTTPPALRSSFSRAGWTSSLPRSRGRSARPGGPPSSPRWRPAC